MGNCPEKGTEHMIGFKFRGIAAQLILAVLLVFAVNVSSVDGPELGMSQAVAQTSGNVPGNWSGNINDAQFWRSIRKGVYGTVSIPDKMAGQLVQSDGDELRAFRNGPMSQFGGWILLAMVLVLALFFVLRGRIRVDAGLSGVTIERFNAFERFVHWMTASSFIILALSGLNTLYGKYLLPTLIGKSAFATLSMWGKLAHTSIAWAFMLGIILMFVMWVKDNIGNKGDLEWLLAAGGLFSKNVHPPSRRFNAGQKLIFWFVILGGGSSALSGISLMFPFEIQLFAMTFEVLNVIGFNFPTELTPLQETQYALMWHGLLGLFMIAVIIGHIYIGSLGMEGAFDAVGTGQVDVNWAKEHHNLWVEEMEQQSAADASTQPAE
jgi:formate dehydrogenase subunit gamma